MLKYFNVFSFTSSGKFPFFFLVFKECRPLCSQFKHVCACVCVCKRTRLCCKFRLTRKNIVGCATNIPPPRLRKKFFYRICLSSVYIFCNCVGMLLSDQIWSVYLVIFLHFGSLDSSELLVSRFGCDFSGLSLSMDIFSDCENFFLSF